MPLNRGMSATFRLASLLTSTSRSSRYQGSPFKSGTCPDGSGNPPAICINDMTNRPAHPPPINAAKTHQEETIVSPPSGKKSRSGDGTWGEE